MEEKKERGEKGKERKGKKEKGVQRDYYVVKTRNSCSWMNEDQARNNAVK